jgi:hypothetical protein
MTPRRVSLLILVVLLLGLPTTRWALGQAEAQPARLALGQTEAQSTRQLQAVFSSTNPGGIVTDVLVEVTDAPDGAEAVIEVSRYRPTCANKGCPQVLLHAFNRVPLAAGALQMSGELNAATLRATGPVRQPLVAGVGNVSFDLTWTAVGTLVRDEHEEGERFRHATAAGALRAGTTNFTPQVSIDATIEEW